MITAPCSRPPQKLKLALVLFFALTGAAIAAEPWRILIEPTFMNYDAAWPIMGAKYTALVPARMVNGEVTPLKRSEILSLGVTRKQILTEAPAAAAQVLATLTPEYVRDANKVIQYAVLQSDSQLTASAVLAPGFADKFADTLGSDILVAIPNRNHIFIFPKLSSIYKSMADIVIAEYKSSPCPVSEELFSFRNGKLIAVGTYQ